MEETTERYRSIWISDIHLGTRGCRAEASGAAIKIPSIAALPVKVSGLVAFGLLQLASRPAAVRARAGEPPAASAQREPGPITAAPAAAPGHPYGESAEVITPLNVRDPSALVMAPSR